MPCPVLDGARISHKALHRSGPLIVIRSHRPAPRMPHRRRAPARRRPAGGRARQSELRREFRPQKVTERGAGLPGPQPESRSEPGALASDGTNLSRLVSTLVSLPSPSDRPSTDRRRLRSPHSGARGVRMRHVNSYIYRLPYGITNTVLYTRNQGMCFGAAACRRSCRRDLARHCVQRARTEGRSKEIVGGPRPPRSWARACSNESSASVCSRGDGESSRPRGPTPPRPITSPSPAQRGCSG